MHLENRYFMQNRALISVFYCLLTFKTGTVNTFETSAMFTALLIIKSIAPSSANFPRRNRQMAPSGLDLLSWMFAVDVFNDRRSRWFAHLNGHSACHAKTKRINELTGQKQEQTEIMYACKCVARGAWFKTGLTSPWWESWTLKY